MALDKELLDILACPKCKEGVVLAEDKKSLICNSCKLVFSIKDDIPIMLLEEAKKLEE